MCALHLSPFITLVGSLGTASTSVRRIGKNQYILGSHQESDIALTAQLSGPACAFRLDISDLTIESTY